MSLPSGIFDLEFLTGMVRAAVRPCRTPQGTVMAYVLFLLANAALYIRPAELFPALGNVQIYLALIVAAMFCSIRQLHNQVRIHTLIQQPINLCVVGVTVATATSHLSLGYVGGATRSFEMMAKVCLYYLTLVAVINTPLRLRGFLLNCVGCSIFMIGYCVLDYHQFVEDWGGRADLWEVKNRERDLGPDEPRLLRHVPEGDEINAAGDIEWYFRLCGLGIFHDPNDMAQLIVMTGILCLYFMTDPKLTGVRYLWIPALGICGYALFLTHSRGGILAGGVALMGYLATRFGGRVAAGIGAMGALAVPVLLGRQGNIDLSGGTGQQRIQLWADGLNQLKTSRFFFGIGEGMYAEVAGLVAHNSYVHAYVELGFIGGTFFLGCFFIPAWSMFSMIRHKQRIEHEELRRMMPYLAGMSAGWCMSMMSLSRCYMPTTYMICGTLAVFMNLIGFYRLRPAPIQEMDRPLTERLVFASGALLGAFFVFVKVFARFG
jgi:hypothetical protein